MAAALTALTAVTGAEAGVRVRESHANLDIALRVAEQLRAEGVTVYLTRTTDRGVSPRTRTGLANRQRADAFVSIHNNASRSRSVSGTEVYRSIRYGYSKDLGSQIGKGFRDTFGPERRAVVRTRRGCCGDYYYQLRNTTMASALVEAAYVSNPNEGRALGSDAGFRQQLADSISAGILRWQARLGGTPPARDPGVTVPAPLPPPLELTARPLSDYRALLTWRTDGLAHGYRIYRDGVLIGERRPPETALDDLDGRPMSFIDRWATPGSTFVYVVRPTVDVSFTARGEGAPAATTLNTPSIRVVLDPGHGGRDPGAVRRW